jgi:hypothetical protein
MSSVPENERTMSPAECSLVVVLRERQGLLGRLGYPNARRMLKQGDRFVEDLTNVTERFLYVSGQAIQDLGPEHGNQIEVLVSVLSDDAHIGSYVYFGPDSPPEIDAKVFRRPLDPTVTYNMCELVVPVASGGGPPSNKSLERTRDR